MQADTIEPVGLTADQACLFVGMSRRAFDELWKNEQAPPAYHPFRGVRNVRFSKDELRAWVAHGYPPLERWRQIWAKLLEAGAWAPTEVVIRERGHSRAV